MKLTQLLSNKKITPRTRVALVSGIIGGLIVSSIVLSIYSSEPSANNGNELGEDDDLFNTPSSHSQGFYSNQDLANYRDWNAMGRDGNTWESAYLIQNMTFSGNFWMSATTKYVIFTNCTFEDKITVFSARNVRFEDCTLNDKIDVKFSRQIHFHRSMMNTISLKFINSQDLHIRGNILTNSTMKLVNTWSSTVAYNEILGSFSLELNAWSKSNEIYANTLISCTDLSVSNSGHYNAFEKSGAGQIISLDMIREHYPHSIFDNFSPLSSEIIEEMESLGLDVGMVENLFVFDFPIIFGSLTLENAVCYIPNIVPHVEISLLSQVAEPNIYSFDIPQIDITIDDRFYIASEELFLRNSTHTKELSANNYGELLSGEYDIVFNATTIFGESINEHITFTKDIDAPEIHSVLPDGEAFGLEMDPIIMEITDITEIKNIQARINQSESIDLEFEKYLADLYLIDFNPLWSDLDNGEIEIELIVVDQVSLNSSCTITLIKDTSPPELIVEMEDISVVGTNTPTLRFNVSVYDTHEVDVELRINGENVGEIDYSVEGDLLTLYNSWIHGINHIRFTATDELNNQNSTEFFISFDLEFESLELLLDDENTLHYNQPPSFLAIFEDEHFEYAVYSISGYLFEIELINGTNVLVESMFNLISQGEHTLIATAYDSFGNSMTAEITFIKDTIAPELIIISPFPYDMFFKSDHIPTLVVNCTDSNLKHIYLLETWDSTRKRHYFNLSQIDENGNIQFTLSPSLWARLSENRYVNLTIYAEDEAGNITTEYVIIVTDPTYYLMEDRTYLWIFIGIVALGTGYAAIKKIAHGNKGDSEEIPYTLRERRF